MPQFFPNGGAVRRPTAGQAVPITGPGVSNATAEAFGRMGQVVEGAALDAITQQTAEQRRLEQLAEDANKARGLAATGEAKIRLHDTMRSLSDRILRGEVDGVAALGEWDSARTQIASDLTKELPGHIAERVGAQIKLDASELASTGIGRAVETRQREVTRADLNTSLEGFERDALTDRGKALTLAGAAISTLGASAGYGPDDQQRLLQGFREKTAANMAEQRLLASSRDPAKLDAFEQQLRGEDFNDLSPHIRERFEVRIENKRAALQHAAEVAQRRLEAARARRLTEAEHAVRAVESIVDGGGIADDATLAKAQTAAMGTPWADVLKSTVQQAASRSAFGSLPPAQQEQALLQIRAQLNQRGANPHQMRQLQQFEAIRNRTREQVERDPLTWGVQSRLLDGMEPLRIDSLNDLVQSIDARVSQARTVGAALRQPVSPLLASEAQALGGMLAPLPPSQKASALQALAARMDPAQAQALAQQINPKDRALSLALAAGSAETNFDRLTSELILRGQAAIDGKVVVKDDAAETGLTARITNKLDGAITNPVQLDALRDAAKLIYYAKRAENTPISAEAATEIAVRGKVYEFNGAKIVFPQGIDDWELQNRLRSYPADALRSQLPDGKVYVRGQPIDASQFLAALPSAQLRTVARGTYAVTAGGTVATNSRNVPVLVYATPPSVPRPAASR